MYGDQAKLLALLQRCQQDARNNPARQARDRADLQNLRMNRGGEENQWIVWDSNSNNYVPRPQAGEGGLPPWFFRATTPLLANKIDGITAILNQSQPAKNWYATRDDDRSRAASDVAELADPVLLEEVDYPHGLRPRLNKLVSLTNLAAVVITYDTDPKWGEDQIPILQCADCQEYVEPMEAPDPADPCPHCGSPNLDFAVDPRDPYNPGPLTMPYPKGKMSAELLSSFEVSLPRAAAHAHEDYIPWVLSHQRWSTEDAISRWPKLKEVLGTNKNGANSAKANEQAYADQMRYLSAPVQANQVGVTAQNVGPVIWRLWHDPIDDDEFYFPDGVFLTVLEGEDIILDEQDEESGEYRCQLAFKDDHDRPFKNVLIRQFDAAPGTPWGKPPADDLVPLQKQLNLAQALAFLILMHHASPRTFIPSTVTLHDKLTGMPGKDIGFRALVPGDKPITEPGIGFPEALKWFIEFIVQTFETVSKLNSVLMGERPKGDPTLGEVEILQERGFAAFQAPLEQLVAFERRLSLKMLWIARQCAWSERFGRIVGENGAWKQEAFTGAQLEGHVTLDIDLQTAWPKSPMLTNLRVAKAFELGILNPQDPEVAEEYLRMNDLLDFKESMDADRDHVARQLDAWKAAADPMQIEPPQTWWRLDYHLYRKTQFMKTEEFEQMRVDRPEVAAAIEMHVSQLQLMLNPPMPAEPGEPAKGENGALDGAMQAGAISPARGPGAKGTLDSAVKGGAVRPAGTGEAQRKHESQKSGGAVGRALKSGAIRPAGGNPTSAAPTRPGATV